MFVCYMEQEIIDCMISAVN